MNVKDKINMGYAELVKNGPITIVAFGDSVTHGAVGNDEIDYETVYWNRLRKKILEVRDYVPVNVINAGIGGTTAKGSIERIDTQVLPHNPDVIIVCFGLNDVIGSLNEYISSLEIIFQKCKASGAEVIFMTPNMLNTYVAEGTLKEHLEFAEKTAEMQNGGRMDMYIKNAMELAEKMGITVCDCYGEWKELAKICDTTKLLANHINHPIREMHELFAQKLFDVILDDGKASSKEKESTMYRD